MSTPKIEALAYRIWAYAHPRGWDCTAPEIADHLDVASTTVTNICKTKGWLSRVRKIRSPDMPHHKSLMGMEVHEQVMEMRL